MTCGELTWCEYCVVGQTLPLPMDIMENAPAAGPVAEECDVAPAEKDDTFLFAGPIRAPSD